MNSARLGTFEADPRTGTVEWSSRMYEIYGLPEGEPMTIERFYSTVHPDDRARVRRAIAEAFDPAGDGVYWIEFRVVLPDGSVRWVNPAGRTLFERRPDGTRRAARFTGVVRDITDRKHDEEAARQAAIRQQQFEQALRDSEERFRLATESAALGTFDRNLLTDELHWSPQARRMFGVDSGPIVPGQTGVNRIHPEDRDRVRALIERAADPAGNGEYRAQYRTLLPDGTLRWIDAVGQVKFEATDDGGRRAVRFAGVLWDITEQHQLIDSLRQADARKDEFLAMLAHELRNPLAPLTNAHRLLARSGPLVEAQRHALAMAERQTAQLKRLVDDLLEVSRITRGSIELRCAPMLLGAAVGNAVESVAPVFERRGQRLGVAMPAQPVRIVADAARVAQVLENLLHNAAKFTAAGGSVRIETAERADEVEIRVIDDGIGIEPAKLEEIFMLFAQADATLDRAHGGLGIGLALVRQLVEMHGGSVFAASAGRGLGATFTVRLPVRGPQAGPQACARPVAAAASAGRSAAYTL